MPKTTRHQPPPKGGNLNRMENNMNAYEAKFAREAKDDPTDWIIQPIGNHKFQLLFIGKRELMARVEVQTFIAQQENEQCK